MSPKQWLRTKLVSRNILSVVTNPSDPTTSSSLSPLPYPLTDDKDGFLFITDAEVTYKLAFRSDADYFTGWPFAEHLLSFSIIPIRGKVGAADPRIGATVTHALQLAYEADPELIIAFTCSVEDDLQRHRRVLFGSWYRKHKAEYNRLSYTDEDKLYTAAIFRRSHAHSALIEEVFNETYQDK